MLDFLLKVRRNEKMTESKVTSKYQTTIPKKIRKLFQIKEGDELFFLPYKDKLILEKKRRVKLAEELPLRIKTEPVKDVHEWRAIARKKALERDK